MTITTGFSALAPDLDAAIAYATTHQPRSLQQQLGPSDIGCTCDRKLGYQIAGVPPTHHPSKWLAYIGTAVHAQLGRDLVRVGRFFIETKNVVGQLAGTDVDGTCDLYDWITGCVVDWKIVGAASLARYGLHGPPEQYQKQVHQYGRGWRLRGLPVTDVVIAFLPRTKEFRHRLYWHERYDEQVALQALARAEAIDAAVKVGGRAVLPLLRTANSWCHTCPWWRPGSTDLTTGCPGDLTLPTLPGTAATP